MIREVASNSVHEKKFNMSIDKWPALSATQHPKEGSMSSVTKEVSLVMNSPEREGSLVTKEVSLVMNSTSKRRVNVISDKRGVVSDELTRKRRVSKFKRAGLY
jgi:hypothetical protein